MSSTQSYKVIVLSNINGRLDEVYDRIGKIEEKSGKFNYLFCVGRFLNDGTELKPYTSGEKKITIPTYFISTDKDDTFLPATGKELCNNLTYLGKSGIARIGELQVAFYTPIDKNIELLNAFNSNLEKEDYSGVDILLTNEWPKNLTSNIKSAISSPNANEIVDNIGSDAIAKLATLTCPRYHFSSSAEPLYFERQPYSNTGHRKGLGQDIIFTTRFVALGDFLNSRKQKFMYAYNATPLSALSPNDLQATITQNTTPSPFMDEDMLDKKRAFAEIEREEEENYRKSKMPYADHTPKHQKKDESHPLLSRTDGCWFCLSNPDVEKHLIVSVGDESYIALAKGGITPNHVLIVPIDHVSSVFTSYKKLELEATKFKKALMDRFKDETMIFWERSMVGTYNHNKLHAHLQAIPIPSNQGENVKQIIEDIAESGGFEIVHLTGNVKVNFPYVQIEVPNVGNFLIKSDKRGTGLLQFGRKVVATLIGEPQKEDWKNCTAPKEEEVKNAEEFKSAFKEYDFTLL